MKMPLAALGLTAATLAVSVVAASPSMAKDAPRPAPTPTPTATGAPIKYLQTYPQCPVPGTRHSRPLTRINANNVEVLVSNLCFTYGMDEDTDDARLLVALDGKNFQTTVVDPGGYGRDLHITILNKLNGRVGYHRTSDNGRTWHTLIP
jgi:hypothetical protein